MGPWPRTTTRSTSPGRATAAPAPRGYRDYGRDVLLRAAGQAGPRRLRRPDLPRRRRPGGTPRSCSWPPSPSATCCPTCTRPSTHGVVVDVLTTDSPVGTMAQAGHGRALHGGRACDPGSPSPRPASTSPRRTPDPRRGLAPLRSSPPRSASRCCHEPAVTDCDRDPRPDTPESIRARHGPFQRRSGSKHLMSPARTPPPRRRRRPRRRRSPPGGGREPLRRQVLAIARDRIWQAPRGGGGPRRTRPGSSKSYAGTAAAACSSSATPSPPAWAPSVRKDTLGARLARGPRRAPCAGPCALRTAAVVRLRDLRARRTARRPARATYHAGRRRDRGRRQRRHPPGAAWRRRPPSCRRRPWTGCARRATEVVVGTCPDLGARLRPVPQPLRTARLAHVAGPARRRPGAGRRPHRRPRGLPGPRGRPVLHHQPRRDVQPGPLPPERAGLQAHGDQLCPRCCWRWARSTPCRSGTVRPVAEPLISLVSAIGGRPDAWPHQEVPCPDAWSRSRRHRLRVADPCRSSGSSWCGAHRGRRRLQSGIDAAVEGRPGTGRLGRRDGRGCQLRRDAGRTGSSGRGAGHRVRGRCGRPALPASQARRGRCGDRPAGGGGCRRGRCRQVRSRSRVARNVVPPGRASLRPERSIRTVQGPIAGRSARCGRPRPTQCWGPSLRRSASRSTSRGSRRRCSPVLVARWPSRPDGR